MWRQGNCALLHLPYRCLQNWFGFWKSGLLANDVLMGKWTTREDPKILCWVFPFAVPDQLLTFLNPGFCSEMLTSMGCMHLILLLCGFWLDLANKDTGWRGESGKRKGKVGVFITLLSLSRPWVDSPCFYWNPYLRSGRHSKATDTISVLEWPPLLVPSGLGLLMVNPLDALPIPDGFPYAVHIHVNSLFIEFFQLSRFGC